MEMDYKLKKLGQYSQILSSCLVKIAERGKEKLNQPDSTDWTTTYISSLPACHENQHNNRQSLIRLSLIFGHYMYFSSASCTSVNLIVLKPIIIECIKDCT